MTDVLPRGLDLPTLPIPLPGKPGAEFVPTMWGRSLCDALRANHIRVATRIEELIQAGNAADIPSATGGGRFFYEQDTNILKIDDGAWKGVGGGGMFLPLAGGHLTGNLYIDKTANPTLYLREAGSAVNYGYLQDVSVSDLDLAKVVAAAAARINLEPKPGDGSSNAAVTMFSDTNTTGAVSLVLYQGDGSATIQHRLYADSGDVELCKQGGTVTVEGDGIVEVQAAAGPSYLLLKAAGIATDYADIHQLSNSLDIRLYNDGTAYIYIDPMPDATDEAALYLFRRTNTSGAVSLQMCIGDGTATVQHKFEASGNVELCKVGGNVTVKEGNLYIDKTSNPTLYLRSGASAAQYSKILDLSFGVLRLEKHHSSGEARIEFDPRPGNGLSPARFRFFRNTNTTGAVTVQYFIGDGSGTTQHRIECGTGLITLCRTAGTTTIGSATAGSEKLTVVGDASFTKEITLAYLAGAPASLANGMIWMESDGFHFYSNGGETIVPGV